MAREVHHTGSDFFVVPPEWHMHSRGPGDRTVPAEDLTTILQEAAAGGSRAVDELLPRVRAELRSAAEALLAQERAGHTLQPTALVHEAYLKMVDQTRATYRDRTHFLAVAAGVMRRLLVDHARGKHAAKRGGDRARERVSEWTIATPAKAIDLLELDDALAGLERSRPRAAQIVEMRFFGGLSIDQVATVLNIGTATVEREWRLARAMLYNELKDG